MPTLRVLDKPETCYHCGEPIEAGEAVRHLDGEVRHERDCPEWQPSGPVSDGTLRCPRTYNGMPCQKRIPAGWHENEGHGGGHWFEPDEHAQARLAGELHIDAGTLLALEPAEEHAADQCPDPTTCLGATTDRPH